MQQYDRESMKQAGEMDFKVEGPWKTEKYCRPTRKGKMF